MACLSQIAHPETDLSSLSWEYSGGFGKSWIHHIEGSKWILFRGDNRTFLYAQTESNKDFVQLHSPTARLTVRLTRDNGALVQNTRTSDWKPWVRGKWVAREDVPPFPSVKGNAYRIKVVYLVPSDREPILGYKERIKTVTTFATGFYRNVLRASGHAVRDLEFEGTRGALSVELWHSDKTADYFAGDGPDSHYAKVLSGLRKRNQDPERQVTVVFCETYSQSPAAKAWEGHVARGSALPPEGGLAVYSSWLLKDEFTAPDSSKQARLFFDDTPIPGRSAFGHNGQNSPRFEFVEDGYGAVIHELGHALGLPHDTRQPQNLMGGGFRNIRFNLDPRTPFSKKARFSNENADFLVSSRYLTRRRTLDDYIPPTASVTLLRRNTTQFVAEISVSDNESLSAVLLYDRTREPATVCAGYTPKSRRDKRKLTLTLTPAAKPEPVVELFVSDKSGNVARIKVAVPIR